MKGTLPTLSVMTAIVLLGVGFGALALPAAELYHTSSSLNWGGFVSYTSAGSPQPVISKVSASWTQPSVQVSKSAKYSSFWLGVGGFTEGTLIQTGTSADTNNNQASYYAWYEMLPAGSIAINCLTIKVGDHISAYVEESSSNNWIIDITTDGAGGGSASCSGPGGAFHQTFSYASSKKSAEWIAERPSLCFVTCQLTKLANFGTVTFTSASYVASGVTYTISGAGAGTSDSVLMVSNGGKILCDVQPRSNPGSTFNAIWKASG